MVTGRPTSWSKTEGEEKSRAWSGPKISPKSSAFVIDEAGTADDNDDDDGDDEDDEDDEEEEEEEDPVDRSTKVFGRT